MVMCQYTFRIPAGTEHVSRPLPTNASYYVWYVTLDGFREENFFFSCLASPLNTFSSSLRGNEVELAAMYDVFR